jgi:hypothetical protein
MPIYTRLRAIGWRAQAFTQYTVAAVAHLPSATRSIRTGVQMPTRHAEWRASSGAHDADRIMDSSCT